MNDASDLRARLAAMSTETRARIEQQLLAMTATRRTSIPRRPSDGPSPLSFAQERLWFLERFEPGSAVYNVPQAYRVRGALDLWALEEALSAVVQRHEVLRTVVVEEEGRARQEVRPASRVPVPLVDVSAIDAEAREDESRRLLEEEARRPFDLTRDVMLRALVIRLGPDEYRLLLVLHHIATDGWSAGVLARELGAFYEAAQGGRPAAMAPLPIQYADYACWQRQDAERLSREAEHWRRRLAGAPPLLALPTDRPRPGVQRHRGAERLRLLPRALVEGARALARTERATLFMVLLAGLKVLLSRYSGQEDVVVGTAVAGRTRVETEPLIGCFVNTLALRTDVSGEPSFRELLRRVREVSLEAYAHQEAPFERLVEELRPERNLGWAPVVQVMFVLQDADRVPLRLPGLELSPMRVGTGTAKFDLSASLMEGAEGLEIRLEYDTDLFDGATIERLLGHYEQLLSGAVAAPETPISRLPLLTATERRQLLDEWSGEGLRFPQDATLASLFEEQAERAPDAVALTFERTRLTYAELNARGTRLASWLRGQGVGRGALVGICLHRSLDLVVAIVGVLKAGAAYVPLDPHYPPARLAFMLDDAQVSLVLSHSAVVERVPAPGVRVICLDQPWPALEADGPPVPVERTVAGDLAYVIYTSGSTGNPKGVCVTHHNVVRLFRATEALFRFGPADVWTLFHSFAFDFSVWEIWGALLHGGRLVVVPHLVSRSPEELRALLSDEGVTVLNQTPSAFRSLVEADGASDAPLSLRYIIFGGEALDPRILQPWIERHGDARPALVNMYGITETTVHVTAHRIHADEVREPCGSPIGRPLSDLRVYVLDRHRQPVPIGVPGELHVGGAGVACGYLRRPELTAERFVEDPWADDPGARLYRSGDLVRYRADGTLDFIGRGDDQVKIRGHRVELGEIEAVLKRQPGVREAVVVRAPDARLIAYVVPGPDTGLRPAALRASLGSALPEYMMPSAFVTLDHLPLTAHGKLDRRALPEPADGDLAREEGFVAPRTELEQSLARIWAEVLGLERVGVHENFFALGGHSILATRAMARLTAEHGVSVPLRWLFEAPTVAELATVIRDAERANEDGLPPIVPVGRDRPLPLSFMQERFWFLAQLDPDRTAYQNAWVYRVRGPLVEAALRRGLDEVVRRHEVLRTTFRMGPDGRPEQVIGSGEPAVLEVSDLRAVATADRAQRAMHIVRATLERPMDLTRGPLLRWLLVRLDDREHLLAVVSHHIISDAWSNALLYRELSELYEAACTGRVACLPAVPIQYADFSVWQREVVSGPLLARQLEYWRRRLAGPLTESTLPTDRPRPPVRTFAGAQESVILPRSLTAALGDLGRQESASLFMILLAALATLLQRQSGEDDVVVGSPIAGRERPELQQLLGCVLNTVVLRTDLSGDPTFRELLGRVRAVALEAYEHSAAPFEQVLEIIRPSRDRSRTPLFQVQLNMHDIREELRLFGLEVTPVPSPATVALFDVNIYFKETAEGVRVWATYNVDLFEAARVRELLGQLSELLADVAARPDRRLSEYSLVTAAARAVLPSPTAPLDDTWHGPVHAGLAAHAARRPAATAVRDGHGVWTSSELNARANQLAHALRARGVGREQVVSVYAHRSAALVWALMGILKAGAAFNILDPAYPEARLLDCVDQTQPRAWIEIAGARARPPGLAGVAERLPCRIRLGPGTDARLDDGTDLERFPTANPEIPVAADDLACISFTSGSTGRPKGILCRHGPLSHFLPWQADTFALGESDRFSLLSGLAHDPLQRDVFTALWVGGSICVPDPARVGDPGWLAGWMAGEGITVAHLTPAMLQLLADTTSAGAGGTLTALRYVFTVGDVLTRRDVMRLRRLAPRVAHVNLYGATETQRAVGHLVLPADEGRLQKDVVPLGRGVPDAQLLVLSRGGRLAGVGELGEIHVRSPHLARGYLGDPVMTAERFIPNPFSDTPGDRLYRTGDLGRYLPDGTVEFAGRSDTQVKVRGFRVELGEIEATMGRHPDVREAVVVARETPSATRELTAYVVAATPTLDAPALRQFLRERLPEYMLPRAVMVLEALPLTPNGKVDRAALPEPTAHEPGGRVPPRSPLEHQLAQIWEAILGVPEVGLGDDFFALGGHSLLAARMMHEVEQVCGRRVPLAVLFEEATIAHLARAIVREGSETFRSRVTAVRSTGDRPPFFMLHGDFDGGGFYCRPLAQRLGPDQPVYALHPHGLDGRPVPGSIEAMAAEYLEVLRSLQPRGPYFLGGHCNGGMIAFELAQRLRRAGQEVALLVIIDASARNHRFWLLRRAVDVLGALGGVDQEARQERFVRGRAAWLRLEASGRSLLRRASDRARRRPGEQLTYLRRNARVLGEALARALGRRHRFPAVAAPPAGREQGFGPPAGGQLGEGYRRALAAYVPARYPGRVTLFIPADEGRTDDTLGWEEVATHVDVHTIRGDHLTCLTRHIDSLATALRRCLDAAQRR